MSKISLKPADTGTATFTLEAPATNTNRTLTLPDEAGTLLTNGSEISQSLLFSGFRNGITMIDQYRLVASTSVSQGSVVSTNIERVDDSIFSTYSSSMSESSGIFTFPSGGIYLINCTAAITGDGDNFFGLSLEATQDSSSYNEISRYQASAPTGLRFFSIGGSVILNITNTATDKVRFSMLSFTNATDVFLQGTPSRNDTSFTFVRIGDN